MPLISRRRLLTGAAAAAAAQSLPAKVLAEVPYLSNVPAASLAFPAGVSPRFNPTHPLAAGISANNGFSGIARSGNFVSLLTGQPGTIAGTPTSNILSSIGPATGYATGGNHCSSFAGQFQATSAQLQQATFASIIQFDSAPLATSVIFATTGTTTAGLGLYISSASKFGIVALGGTNAISVISVAGGIPYFLAASTFSSGSAYFVLVNLQTGSLLIDTQSRAIPSATANSGTYNVGNTTASNRPATGKIATVMFSPLAASPQQLVQAAYDPWSFWYS